MSKRSDLGDLEAFTDVDLASAQVKNLKSNREGEPLDASDRFWSKVVNLRGCWVWTGATDSHGYGSFWHEGRMVSAHRYAYAYQRGPIPGGARVVPGSECGNRLCVKHLELR